MLPLNWLFQTKYIIDLYKNTCTDNFWNVSYLIKHRTFWTHKFSILGDREEDDGENEYDQKEVRGITTVKPINLCT